MRVSYNVPLFVSKYLGDAETIHDNLRIGQLNDLLQLTSKLVEGVGIVRLQRTLGRFSLLEWEFYGCLVVLWLVDAIARLQVDSLQQKLCPDAYEEPLSRVSDEQPPVFSDIERGLLQKCGF